MHTDVMMHNYAPYTVYLRAVFARDYSWSATITLNPSMTFSHMAPELMECLEKRALFPITRIPRSEIFLKSKSFSIKKYFKK